MAEPRGKQRPRRTTSKLSLPIKLRAPLMKKLSPAAKHRFTRRHSPPNNQSQYSLLVKMSRTDRTLERYGCYIPITSQTQTRAQNNKQKQSRQMDIDAVPSTSIPPEHERQLCAMESGHRICKIALNKRWDPIHQWLSIKLETRQMQMFKSEGPVSTRNPLKPTQSIDLRHIKEVMTLDYKRRRVRVHGKWTQDKELNQFDRDKILVILHGSAFVLKQTILLFDEAQAATLWADGLHYLVHNTLAAPHPLVIERWLRKQFYDLADPMKQTLAQKNMKPFVQSRLQYKVQSKFLQEITEDHMRFDAFADAYRQLVHDHSLFSDKFSALACVNNNNGLEPKVDLQRFTAFLQEDQKESFATDETSVSLYLRRYIREIDMMRDTQHPYLNVREFIDYLFSRHNSLFDPKHHEISQDMDRPLCEYWIASSHNTYLTGDQIQSNSELEAYSRALLMGCRCIELDCWNPTRGGDDDIVIYHGFTLTSKLSLKDVLHTIKEYAFITSDYPVILSIEDNCTVASQRKLASQLKNILGDLLLTACVNRDEKQLPSPKALRGRIILKHKKLSFAGQEPPPAPVVSQMSNTSVDELAQSDQDWLGDADSSRRAVLWMYDPTRHDRWVRRVFVLMSDRLAWSADDISSKFRTTSMDMAGSHSDIEDLNDDSSLNQSRLDVRPEDVHMTEDWFHGSIGREEAEPRLLKHAHLGDGLFLVRDSKVFVGDLSVSILYKDQVHHCRIRSKFVDGEKKYFFHDRVQKDTVYQLICYYQQYSLTTAKFKIRLTTPCPQPTPYIDQPWYAGNIDKRKAEQLLNLYPEDGAFLFRKSGSDDSVFVLSWRVDDEIKHMRLKTEGRMLVVHNMLFEQLNDIVEYYHAREFWHGVCLKYAVNQDAVDAYAAAGNEGRRDEGTYMDINSASQEITVRSTSQYCARDSSELSFPAGALITVFHKTNDHMWRGRYNNTVGWFPSNKVVDINNGNGDGFDGCISLTGCVIERLQKDDENEPTMPYVNQQVPTRPYSFVVRAASAHWNRSEHEVRLAADSRESMTDWINQLTEMARIADDKASELKSREKVLRIASELSDLVVYCQAVPFPKSIPGNFYEMCSFSEKNFNKLFERGLCRFNQHQLSRVYPKATRVDSTNYDPTPMWNAGVQMTALNYQTADRPMQLNQGRFKANGGSGYVLKPAYMLHPDFDPENPDQIDCGNVPVTLTIVVIAGRHLIREQTGRDKDRTRGYVSPVVEVEVVGLPSDCQLQRTRAITSDGLHPVWNETFEFSVLYPECALLRFNVEDGDFVRNDQFLGQCTVPLDCIRTGYRSVQLSNAYSEEFELSSLLVHVERRTQNVAEQNALAHVRASQSTASVSSTPKSSLSNTASSSKLITNGANSISTPQFDSGACDLDVSGSDQNPTPTSSSGSKHGAVKKKKSVLSKVGSNFGINRLFSKDSKDNSSTSGIMGSSNKRTDKNKLDNSDSVTGEE